MVVVVAVVFIGMIVLVGVLVMLIFICSLFWVVLAIEEDWVGVMVFTWIIVFVGITALATFFKAAGLTISDVIMTFVDFPFMLIIGAVVDVPQSVHTSLYSTSLRPHFRQNGICSLCTFRCKIAMQALNFNYTTVQSYLNV